MQSLHIVRHKTMKNQQLIFVLLLALLDPSFGFLFGGGKKEKKSTPVTESSIPCPTGEPLKEKSKIIRCTPGLGNLCPLSHQCHHGVCCLLPEEQQFNPCKTGTPLKDPLTKAHVHCTFTQPDHFSCPSGYECNMELMDVSNVCCPVRTSALTEGSTTPEIKELVANVSHLWEKVNELQKCCACGKNVHKGHDLHQHQHNHPHEDDEHLSQQHGEGGDHYHQHKHGKHYFDKTAEVHAHCEMKPNGALSLSKIVPIRGFIHLKQKGSSELQMHISLAGWPVSPNTKRTVGLHVHEFGDLRNNCESLGEHYNPANVSHGGPADTVRHPGDFGNFEINAEGKINVMKTDFMATLYDGFSIIGRSIVVHESFDDLGRDIKSQTSQTTGNAGHRLACCIIGYSGQEH